MTKNKKNVKLNVKKSDETHVHTYVYKRSAPAPTIKHEKVGSKTFSKFSSRCSFELIRRFVIIITIIIIIIIIIIITIIIIIIIMIMIIIIIIMIIIIISSTQLF